MSDYTPTTDHVRHAADWDRNYIVRPHEFDRWLAEHDAKVRAEAIRSARDELGVYVGDEDSDWWDGYRNGQRRQNAVLGEYADRIEREAGLK